MSDIDLSPAGIMSLVSENDRLRAERCDELERENKSFLASFNEGAKLSTAAILKLTIEHDEAKDATDLANAACDKKDAEIARLVGEVEQQSLYTKHVEDDLQHYKKALENAKRHLICLGTSETHPTIITINEVLKSK